MTKKLWTFAIVGLGCLAVLSVLLVSSSPDRQTLKIVACDVGQGGATLASIEDFQMLVDGGPNNKVVSCLGEHMPFWDRKIEIVVLTHPHADHFAGLIEVFRRYEVGYLVATEDDNDTVGYREFKNLVADLGIEIIYARAGMSIVDGVVSITILNPPEELFARALVGDGYRRVLGSFTPRHVHNYNIVVHLRYGTFGALFTGDIEPPGIARMNELNLIPDVVYMDAPHHGSRNGMDENLLAKARPEIVVISAGENNRYGHPHREVLDMLGRQGALVLGTFQYGDVIVESNGVDWWYNTQKPF